MKKARKLIYVLILLLLLTAASAWYYVFIWSEHHHRNVEDERGIAVSAVQLIDTYEKSEPNGNTLYLDKTVEVTGEVSSFKLNQDGKQTVTLKSGDPMSSVFCTLRENNVVLTEGATITLKGICTGYLSDVIVIDAVIVKNENATNNK